MFGEKKLKKNAKVAEVFITVRRKSADTIVDNFCPKVPACHFVWMKCYIISKIRGCFWLVVLTPIPTKMEVEITVKVFKKVWGK